MEAPDYRMDPTDPTSAITKFTGKFTWRGTITIQTQYGSGAAPADVSCYGRGTTNADVQNRDITLGFHESCHRADYVDYLLHKPLADPPKLSVGMTRTDYDSAVATFHTTVEGYFSDMEKASVQNTDEVGHRLSTRQATEKCFKHYIP
jgi:hypothetical protein